MALPGALALCGFAGGRVPQRAGGKGGESARSHSPLPPLALQSTWGHNQLQGGLCDTKTWDISLLPAREEEEPGGSTSPQAGGTGR